MDIVQRIKTKCKENGTNISNLEKNLGIGNGNIRRWNTQNPGSDKVIEVANALNVSIDWLLTGKEIGKLSEDEQKLVDLYRMADDRGKRTSSEQRKLNGWSKSHLLPGLGKGA